MTSTFLGGSKSSPWLALRPCWVALKPFQLTLRPLQLAPGLLLLAPGPLQLTLPLQLALQAGGICGSAGWVLGPPGGV